MSDRKTRQDFTPVQTMERGEAKESEGSSWSMMKKERPTYMSKWLAFFFPVALEYSILCDFVCCKQRQYIIE